MKTLLFLSLISIFAFEKSHAIPGIKMKMVYSDTVPLVKDSTDKIYSNPEVRAQFPGGDKAWAKHIKKYIEKNLRDIVEDNQSGTCKVLFVVDKEGKISGILPVALRGSKLCDATVEAIKKGPDWIPAMNNGQKVNSYFTQPVSFTISQKER